MEFFSKFLDSNEDKIEPAVMEKDRPTISDPILKPNVIPPPPPPPGGSNNMEEMEVIVTSAEYPIMLSHALQVSRSVTPEIRESFFAKNLELQNKVGKRSNYENAWLKDFAANQRALYNVVAEEANSRRSSQGSRTPSIQENMEADYEPLGHRLTSERRPQSEYYPPYPQTYRKTLGVTRPGFPEEDIRPVDLNKLFVRPDSFNGTKPPPRVWLDQYEKAADDNGWSEHAKVRHIRTFLKGPAYDWLKEVVPMHHPHGITWRELRLEFINCYLGKGDREDAQEEFERAKQREGEKAADFIPTMLRMIRTFDRARPMDVIVNDIRRKLLPEYRDKLTMYEITSIHDLYNGCIKVEAGLKTGDEAFLSRERRIRSRLYNRSLSPDRRRDAGRRTEHESVDRYKFEHPGELQDIRNSRKFRSPSPDRGRNLSPVSKPASQRANSPSKETSDNKCYRCGRNNHWARDCVAKTRLDGSPCVEKSVTFDRSVSLVSGDSSTEPTGDVVNAIRIAGRNFCNTIMPNEDMNVLMSMGSLLRHEITCGGRLFNALIDTGAYISAIDSQVAKNNDWQPKKTALKLYHALGEEMTVHGNIELVVSLKIGNTTRRINHEFAVIQNLCTQVIVGINFIRALNIIIQPANKIPLSFGKQIKPKGVRAEEVLLPPRSINLINGTVATESQFVMVLPFGFDQNLYVGNAVCEVKHNTVKIPIVNLDVVAVQLTEGIQIASIHPLPDEKGGGLATDALVNAVLPIAETEAVTVGDDLTTEQIGDLKNVLTRNINAFSLGGEIGLAKIFEHSIELVPDAKPFAEPVRRHPRVHVDEANAQVQDMLRKGIIEESSSPWASEYVMVPKKTGEWRMCIDYRRLNSITKKNSYPLPNIEDCLEALAGKAYYSKLDFASGYWQMPIEEKSKELTAFRTGEGLYQFRVMPFGLTNAPASFQKMINLMFAGLKGLNLQVFLDDVCIATATWEQHLDLVDQILKIIISHNLKLKGSKCAFGERQIIFLGHKISKEGITQDPDKLRAFSELQAPKDVHEVRRVLGMFGYYRRFVYRFSSIAEPIINLTRKGVEFCWGEDQEAAFVKLKKELLENATLAHYSPTDPTMLKTDASKTGIAAMLLQQKDGDWKLVSCISRRLSSAERNYGITELEGLAIVYSVQKLRAYLLGREFVIITDHCALCSLGKKVSQNNRLRRWAIVLSEYNFTVIYRKGALHCDVDCLSRAPVCDEDDKFLDKIFAVNEMATLPQPLDNEEWIRAYDDDESNEFRDLASTQLEEFFLKEGLIYKRNRLYVPSKLRLRMIKENHDEGAAAHDGVENTQYRMRFFWWPSIKDDLKHYVQGCQKCQLRKSKRTAPHGTLQPHTAFTPFELIAFDHIGPWHATITNKRFICVGIDVYSRFVFAKAVNDQAGITFAEYLNEVIGVFGIPQTILTDNSKAFDNSIVRTLEKEYGITHRFSAPHHSQGNAVVERAIESLEEKLSLIQQESNLDWEQAIPLATLSMNTRRNVTTGFAPYELMFNRTNPTTSRSLRKNLSVPLKHDAVVETRADAVASTSNAHAQSKTRYDRAHNPTVFEIGSLVMSKRSSRRSKLSNRYEGPCEVLKRDKDIYTIRNQLNDRVLIRHASHLERFRMDGVGNLDPGGDVSSTDSIDNDGEYPASGTSGALGGR